MKKNSKRKVLLAAIAVLCAVLLSGCQLENWGKTG